MEAILVGILSSVGTAGIVFCVVFKYYNNVKNCISDIVSFFAATCGWFKTTSTKMSIETNGTESINTLNRIVPELNLPELSIEWVKTDEHGKVRLEPGKAIVLLKYDKDNTQNIINTTAAYVQKTLLLNSKPFLDIGIRKAIDFAVIRKFLSRTPQKNYIVTQYIDSCTEDIVHYGEAFSKVIKVEDEGLLTRVLLREYAIWGNRLIGKTRNDDLIIESRLFLDYIYNIASRDFDELTPLVFNKKTLKVAILLVAKYDTYAEKGIEPYVRRIREGFANGINSFYLLARNDKIAILERVYGEIISTGNYNLLNGPKEYKDNSGRSSICYCIEVKADADLAQAYTQIKECIDDEKPLEVTVVDVFKDKICCTYNGISLIVSRENITNSPDLRLKSYFYNGMAIEVVPINIGDGGVVNASVLQTKSNPQNLFNNKYEVGSQITAIVQSTEDDFITLLVKNSNQECVAYRRNITNSRFAFLHNLYPVGSEFEFIIKNINYIYNQLELKAVTLTDPWQDLQYKTGNDVEFEIFNIKETCAETELSDGAFAILPYSELTWFENEIASIKATIKRGKKLKGYIKRIDKEQKLIILSLRDKVSPYIKFFNSLPDDKITRVKIEGNNAYGVLGLVESKYHVFIPTSETYIGNSNYPYKLGKEYDIKLKEVDRCGLSFIGTFKPFIANPLQFVKDQFTEGQVLSKLHLVRVSDSGVYFQLKGKRRNQLAEVLLLNAEVSDSCFVRDLGKLFEAGYSCPMVIKTIDLDRNIVLLSIKELTVQNKDRLLSLNYGKIYSGRILGRKFGKYYVLLDNIWIEVPVESSNDYQTGDLINVMKISSTSFIDEKELEQSN